MTKQTECKHKLIQRGLCPQCGRQNDRDGYYCTECNEKHNERARRDREFFAKNGLCRVCGKDKPVPGTTYCEACSQRAYILQKQRYENNPEYVREHNRISSKKRYEECKAQGICTRCRKRKSEFGKTKCRQCLDKDALRHKYNHKTRTT